MRLGGSVLSEIEKKPVEFGTLIILEERKKLRFREGRFSVKLSRPGIFTFRISSPGFSRLEKKINVFQGQNLIFYLSPATFRTKRLKVRDRKAIQKLSRNTLSQRDIKNIPATFGDSLNALTSLPSVIRSNQGFLGNLLIRGANDTANQYYIDHIPVLYPQHFGGIQSIISNELIERIDLYSSNFPAPFGQAQGAVIDITTKDTVKNFNAKLIFSFLSSDAYFEGNLPSFSTQPAKTSDLLKNIQKQKNQTPLLEKNQNKDTKNQGYWIVSGRISYLTLTLSPILDALSTDKTTRFQLPQYYDYQLKGKYFLDQKSKHSIGLLFFGFYDTFKFTRTQPEEENIESAIESGLDPLFANSPSNINNSVFSNSIGIYYRFVPSPRVSTKFLAFAVLNQSNFSASIEALRALNPDNDKTLDINIRPNLYELKNISEFFWYKDIAFLKFGLESIFYHFQSNGFTQSIASFGRINMPDFLRDDLFRRVDINFSKTNMIFSSFVENTFDIYNLKIVTGIHLAYLDLNQVFTYDPRLLLSYGFDWEMIISAGYGLYSSFPQANYFLFNRPFNQQPEVARSAYIQPEKARHISVGIEQSFPIFSVKMEGFYNTFWDQLISNPDRSSSRVFINSASIRSAGFEFLIRLAKDERRDTFYGWLSYTFTNSIQNKNITDLESSPYSDQWLTSQYEQPHSLKLVMGYIFGQNNIGLRFELNSGLLYTPIIRNSDPTLIAGRYNRYSPVYGKPYSERFPINHRLDLRYTRTSIFNWGSIDWYLEVINVYFYRPYTQLNWNYNKPYASGQNPTLGVSFLSYIIPNFGVEIRF